MEGSVENAFPGPFELLINNKVLLSKGKYVKLQP